MAGMTEKLTGQHVLDADLADWRLMVRALHAHFATGDFATGIRLAERISAAAEEMNHHPDIDLRYPHVAVRLTSHDTGGVTERDVELARRISAAAADLGVAAEPSRVSLWELALDTADHDAIKPFWRAILGYDQNPSAGDEINDPAAGGAHALVPGHRAARRAPAALPPRRVGAARRGRAADRRRAGRGRDDGQRRPGAVVLGARRRRRQQGVHLHLAGPRLSVASPVAGIVSQGWFEVVCRLVVSTGLPGKPVLVGCCSARQAPEVPVRWAGTGAIGLHQAKDGDESQREGAPRGTRCHDVGPPSQHLGSVVDCLDAGTPRRRT